MGEGGGIVKPLFPIPQSVIVFLLCCAVERAQSCPDESRLGSERARLAIWDTSAQIGEWGILARRLDRGSLRECPLTTGGGGGLTNPWGGGITKFQYPFMGGGITKFQVPIMGGSQNSTSSLQGGSLNTRGHVIFAQIFSPPSLS